MYMQMLYIYITNLNGIETKFKNVFQNQIQTMKQSS